MKTDKCRSCGAAVVWVETVKGKRMPLDVKPNEKGNIMLREREGREPLAIYVSDQQRESSQLKLFVSHFATCPQSKGWRKK
jgi:hypothetical protein